MQIDICPSALGSASYVDVMVDNVKRGWISSKPVFEGMQYHAVFQAAPGLNTSFMTGIGSTRKTALLDALAKGSKDYQRMLALVDEMKQVVINKIGEE